MALIAGAVAAAAVLSSLPPPAKALASAAQATARVGPGAVTEVVNKNGYRLEFRVSPNRAAAPNTFCVKVTRGGRPVRMQSVLLSFAMLDMEMGEQTYHAAGGRAGRLSRDSPALVMVGHWGLSFEVTPPGQAPFKVIFVDRATG